MSMSMIRRVNRLDADDILGLLGLRRKHSLLLYVLPALGCALLGAVIGLGCGLAFAPSAGRRLRQNVAERLDHMKLRMKNAQHKVEERVGANAAG